MKFPNNKVIYDGGEMYNVRVKLKCEIHGEFTVNTNYYYNYFGMCPECLKLEIKDPKTANGYDKDIFRYRIKLTKTGILKYFSHLDWQNTFLKALSRTDLNIVYSLGYNPMMKVSMGIALPLFCESEGGLVDLELFDNLKPEELKLRLEKVLPEESKIISIVKIPKNAYYHSHKQLRNKYYFSYYIICF